MAQHLEDSPIGDAVELLQTNGFDALAEAVTLLMNSAMVAERSRLAGEDSGGAGGRLGRISGQNKATDRCLIARRGAQ